jgi:fucose permease
VLGGASLVAVGLLLVSTGVARGSVPITGVGLVLTGLGVGSWDVAMNVEGADVERRLDRTLMPRFHAGFSVGTVAGALVGAGAAALDVPVQAQLAVTGVVSLVAVAVGVRAFLPLVATAVDAPAALRVAQAWREPRTLLVGVLVLCFAFVEGTANDWLAIALVDGHGTSDAVGALGFACFVTAMTVSRTVGGSQLTRYGRTAVLRTTALLSAAGLLLVVLSSALPVVLLGALLWGAGAALGFPVGMSAAADDETGAAVRVSVVSSIGYTAFLAGPPLVGLLAEPERLGVLRALLVVFVAVVALLVGAAVLVDRDRARDEQRRAAAAAQDVVALTLLRPGQDLAPRYGPRPSGVHLVVANAGTATVRLLSGTVAPGTWQVDVPVDRDLRAGRSRRLELVPPAGCGSAAPRMLVLRAVPPSGRPATVVLDLADAQLAYGGRLDDAVSSAGLTCEPTAGSEVDAT